MSEDLKERFSDHQKQNGGEDGEDGETAEEEAEQTETETAVDSRPKAEIPVRDRNQVTMYLADDREDDISQLFQEANAQSVLADKGEISKNDEFYPAVVDFVTDHKRKEFLNFLGLETDVDETE